MKYKFTMDELKRFASETLDVDLSDVKVIDNEHLIAINKNGEKIAGGSSIPEKMRALTLIAQNMNNDICIHQKRHFERLGMMLDMSRGGVMRPHKVKEFIFKLALYGADYFMLYTEDVFTLEEYPHFGYMRGAYTDEELSDIDNYAAALGIEVIPCIQTLGHHERYLSWSEAANIKDTGSVLLAEEEETYRFIECMIAKMRKVFQSKHIHIGMDETYGLGLGKYLERNGYKQGTQIYNEHLKRVKEICERYCFSPMIWSDMIFRLNGGDYWKTDMKFSKESIEQLPNVDLVYWEYGVTDEEHYVSMIDVHKQLQKNLVFAGGMWTFKGFLPDTFNKTLKAAIPALRACIRCGVNNVLATAWGDDGCETDYFYSLYSFAAYSEICYRGLEAETDDIYYLGEFVSSYPTELLRNCDAFFGQERDFEIYGKTLFYGDIFYNIGGIDWKNSKRLEIIRNAAANIDSKYKYEKLIMNIVLHKAEIYANMQEDYKNGSDMQIYAQKILPELKKEYEEFFVIYAENWERVNKPFGFEKLTARIGGCILRIQAAIDIIKKYSDGVTECIEELEYEPLYGEEHGFHYNGIVSV